MSASGTLADRPQSTLGNRPADAGFLHGPWAVRLGWLLTVLPGAGLLLSAMMKITQQPPVMEMLTGKFGYPGASVRPIGLLEASCALLLLVPRTAVLGGLLVTAYLGGAVATHVRASDPYGGAVAFAVLAWAGLWLRDARIRKLLPLR